MSPSWACCTCICSAHTIPSSFFFFKNTAPPEISPLSLHAALPIFERRLRVARQVVHHAEARRDVVPVRHVGRLAERARRHEAPRLHGLRLDRGVEVLPAQARVRSEEHTSELQSPCNLVCRLLLENK